MEKNVPFTSRTPTYLTSEQRYALTQIPADLSDREIARHYTFTQKDLDLIRQRRRRHNRLGFALQLCTVRFLGTFLSDPTDVPHNVILSVAPQLNIADLTVLSRYREGQMAY